MGAVSDHIPVELDQQPEKAGPGQQVPAEAPVLQSLLQPLQQPGQPPPLLPVRAHQGELPLPGQAEAGGQVLPPGAAGLEKAGVQVDHHPLIGAVRVGHRPVDQVVAHQQHVPGLQKVGPALDDVAGPAGEEDDNLVKLMVVVLHLLHPHVPEVEQPEVLVEIAPALVVGRLEHGFTLSARVGRDHWARRFSEAARRVVAPYRQQILYASIIPHFLQYEKQVSPIILEKISLY